MDQSEGRKTLHASEHRGSADWQCFGSDCSAAPLTLFARFWPEIFDLSEEFGVAFGLNQLLRRAPGLPEWKGAAVRFAAASWSGRSPPGFLAAPRDGIKAWPSPSRESIVFNPRQVGSSWFSRLLLPPG